MRAYILDEVDSQSQGKGQRKPEGLAGPFWFSSTEVLGCNCRKGRSQGSYCKHGKNVVLASNSYYIGVVNTTAISMLTPWEIIVARAAPATSILKAATRRKSRIMLRTQEIATKSIGLFESP